MHNKTFLHHFISQKKQTNEKYSGFVKTDYGYLMTEYKLSKNPKVIGVWANAIIELLNDVNYYEKCVRSAKIRARLSPSPLLEPVMSIRDIKRMEVLVFLMI